VNKGLAAAHAKSKELNRLPEAVPEDYGSFGIIGPRLPEPPESRKRICSRCGQPLGGRKVLLCKTCASHDVSIAPKTRQLVKQELSKNPSFVIDTCQRSRTREPRFPMNERRSG
jgi:hypothetical protein